MAFELRFLQTYVPPCKEPEDSAPDLVLHFALELNAALGSLQT